MAQIMDRDRALAEALAAAVGHGAGEADVTVTTPGLGEGYTGGAMIAKIRVPDWAARTWAIQLGPPKLQGGDALTAGVIATHLGFPTIPALDFGLIPLIGRVVWGAGGASFQADVSWFQGNSFTVHGSYVELRALAFANPPWTNVLPAGAKVTVQGAILPAEAGAARHGRPPMLQSAPVTIAANATEIFLIPEFAVEVVIGRHSGPNNYPTLEVAMARNSAMGNNVFFEIITLPRQFIPIPGNARFMSIRNMTAGPETLHLEFHLNLG